MLACIKMKTQFDKLNCKVQLGIRSLLDFVCCNPDVEDEDVEDEVDSDVMKVLLLKHYINNIC